MRKFLALLLWIALMAISTPSFAQESILMVTYGSDSMVVEGDDDFKQIIFLQVPQAISDDLHLRIFDADCGDRLDSPFGAFDTVTRFRLFGGDGACSAATLKSASPDEKDIVSGTPIADESFGSNPFRDNKWYNFATFSPTAGEKIAGNYVFKLVVEGLDGNDGNIFDVALSRSNSRNLPPDGLEIFSYEVTIRLPGVGIFAEMPFFVPASMDAVSIHNFDLASAKIAVETAYRSDLRVVSSGQGEWAESKVTFEKNERNRLCAVTFEGGGEIPNDATFYLTDNQGEMVPIQMPVYVRKTNNRPVPVIDTRTLSDGRTVVLDGSRSTDEDGEALEFFWDFGDGESDRGARITHRYEKVGDYLAELIVTDDSGQVGNSSLKRFTVIINEPPKAEAGPDLVGMPGQTMRFDGSASVDIDGKITRYVWDFDDGSREEGVAVSHVFRKAGFYEVTLRVEDGSESPVNFGTDKAEVWINAPPVVEIGEDRISSPGDPVVFDNTRSLDSDGEIVSYLWDFGDDSQEAGEFVTHSYDKPGKYRVTLTIKDNADVANTTAFDQLTVVVNDRPISEAGENRRSSIEQTVYFDGSGSFDRDGQIIDYFWQFGDGAEARGQKVSHAYSSDGEYVVTLTVQDNSASTSDKGKDTLTIIVNSQPIAVAGEDMIVTTSEVQLDGGTSGDKDGEIISYHWDFGDGTQGAGPTPLHFYRIPGTYTVRLTITDDSGTTTSQASDELAIVVNEAPIADAGVDQIGAPGQSLTFDGSKSLDPDGQLSGYDWDFGDGQTASGQEVSHTYEKPGIYSVRLAVRDNTGHLRAVDQDEVVVSINAQPVAHAGVDVSAAPGQTVTFDGGGSYDMDGKIVSYQWRFSDDVLATETATQTKRKFSKPGIYSVTLTVTDNSGAINAQAQDKISIYINHAPEARPGEDVVTSSVTVSFDGSKSADADGHPLSYSWDFGDATPPATGVTVSHIYAKGGAYPVVLTVDDGTGLANARNSASITVAINQPPVADAGEDKTIWAGDMVLFDAGGSQDPEGGLLKYYWNFGDETTLEGMNPTKIYKRGGVYQVKLTVKDDSDLPNSSDTDQMVVRVAESPVADAGEDQTVYANTNVQLDGSESSDLDGVVNSFLWDFGDGTTGGGATPTHTYTKPGTYRVLLTIVGDQIGDVDNTDKDEMIVTVVSAPEAKFTIPKVVALNADVQFDGSESSSEASEIVSWKWDFGDENSAEGAKATHAYKAPGKYPVILTVEADMEEERKSTSLRRFIVVNSEPIADAGKEQLVGVNQLTVLNASASKDADGAIVSYDWDFGDGQAGSGIEVQHRFKTSGEFTVTLKITDDTDVENNSDTDTVLVTVNDAPTPVIDVADWADAGAEVQFSGENSIDMDGSIAGYHWDFGDGQSADGVKVSHTYNTPGGYAVTLTADDGTSVSNSKSITTKTLMINDPPASNAGPDQIVGPGEVVTFDASRSADSDGNIVKYNWDFGDGTQGEGKQVTHAYAEPGSYEVRLNVSDNSATASGTVEDIMIAIVNAPPVPEAGPDQDAFCGGAHDIVFFDGTKSRDPDGGALTYLWDFGDKTNATGAKVSHTYTQPGTYTVRLRVRDSSGIPAGQAWDELVVTVKKR